MTEERAGPAAIIVKTTVAHTVTYFVAGIIAFSVFDYAARFAEAGFSSFMRPTDHPLVMAGPLFQPIRGLLFGLVFYLLRDAFFGRSSGWLALWTTLVFLGILSTFGPSPGSIEGLIYTTVPMDKQLFGLTEILAQSLMLSIVTTYWVNHPQAKWLSWTLGVLFCLVIVLPALGLVYGGVP